MSASFLKLTVLDNVLWLAGFLCQSALALVLLMRKNLRKFPAFTGYIVFAALTTPLLFLTSRFGSKHAYFWLFWITAFAIDPIQLLIIAEFARYVFHPQKLFPKNVRQSTILWIVVLAFGAASFAFGIGPPGLSGFDLWSQRESVFASLFVCGSLMVLSAYSLGHGHGARTHAAALALGLFVWSYSNLLLDLYHSVVGWTRNIHVAAYAREFAYLAVLVYWIVKFWNPEKKPPPLSDKMIAYMEALHGNVQAEIKQLERPQ